MPSRPRIYKPSHAPKDSSRGTANSRGYNYTWQQYRINIFLPAHPICECVHPQCCPAGCTRLTLPGGHVDHIIAVKGQQDPLFWEASNHQALCHSCHSKKTAREM